MSNPLSRRAWLAVVGAVLAGVSAVEVEAKKFRPRHPLRDAWALLIHQDGESSVGDTYIGPKGYPNAVKAAQQLNDATIWVTVQPTTLKGQVR